jgi:hypothetical protein
MVWYWTGHGYEKFQVLGGMTVAPNVVVVKSTTNSIGILMMNCIGGLRRPRECCVQKRKVVGKVLLK